MLGCERIPALCASRTKRRGTGAAPRPSPESDAKGLDRHLAADQRIAREVDDAHRALSDLVEDLVAAQFLWRLGGHPWEVRSVILGGDSGWVNAGLRTARAPARFDAGDPLAEGGRRALLWYIAKAVRRLTRGEAARCRSTIPSQIRNIAIAGHNDTGKTTLASALLFASGATPRFGRVEDKNTVTDFDPEEIDRGISIGLAVCFAPWRQHKLNLLDFAGLRHLLLRDPLGSAGRRRRPALRQRGRRRRGQHREGLGVRRRARAAGDRPPHQDGPRARRPRARASRASQKTFGRQVLPIQLPIGEENGFTGVVDLVVEEGAAASIATASGKAKEVAVPPRARRAVEAARTRLVEAVAETDDALMESFFEEGTLSETSCVAGLRTAPSQRTSSRSPRLVGAHLHRHLRRCSTSSSTSRPRRSARPFPAKRIDGDPLEVDADPRAGARRWSSRRSTIRSPARSRSSASSRGTLTQRHDSSGTRGRGDREGARTPAPPGQAGHQRPPT